MKLTRNSLDSNLGPAEWFTGTVYIDTIATPEATARTAAALEPDRVPRRRGL